MKRLLVAAVAMAALAGGVHADPLGDAKAGLSALNGGDYTASIKLFTAALDSGKLVKTDQELAHLKRGEAYLAASDPRSALADANKALDLDPQDKEAMATRDRAQALLTPPPAAPSQASQDMEKAQADYAAAQAKYEAQKQADADAYAKQLADYKAADAKHQADVAAWAACKADSLKCPQAPGAAPGAPAPVMTAQAAPPPKPAPVKPTPEQTAKAAPKPASKPNELPPIAGAGSY
jgi:tetratricopeptide (TPR) repeat protein